MNTEVLEIIKVDYLDDYRLKIYFSDNKIQIINFQDFITNNHNPQTKKYADISNFKCYKIEYGDLIWGDFEMCFPIYDLYEGVI